MNDKIELLKNGCAQLEIDISDEKCDKFIHYLELLLEWNQKFNLTAITDPEQVIVQHFLDSISILKLGLLKDSFKILDMGTGAGFPGIPIKIMLPEVKLVLVDSVSKKVNFLKEAAKELGLSSVEAIHGRAEDLGRDQLYRESSDIVVSRAVAELRVLLEYCLPFVKPGGYFVSYKGPGAFDEINNAMRATKLLGGSEPETVPMDIPYSEKTHILVATKKVSKTPKEYPRLAGKPRKSPL